MTETADKPYIAKLRLKDLTASPDNPRVISEPAVVGLRAAFKELGILDVPVINIHGGKKQIIGGHQRVRILRKEGYTHADCIVVDFDPERSIAANLALNNPHIQGKWDLKTAIPNMDDLIKNIPTPDHLQLQALRKSLKIHASRNPAIGTAFKKHTQKKKAKSKVDVAYRLGDHLITCGDMVTHAEALFGDDTRAQVCVTDPPYNVSYTVGKGSKIENDGLDPKAWSSFMHDACEVILKYVDGPCYVFMSSKGLPDFQSSWEAWGGSVHRWLVWAKTEPTVMITRTVDFQNQYEWIMYGQHDSRDVTIPEDLSTNILACPKPVSNKLHPTQKPLALVEDLLRHSAYEGQIVFDPFLGSGTTLMACEDLGLTCVGCETSPHYVDVIRKRWADHVHGANSDWKGLTPPI